jgi:hypothetical protein
LLTGIGTLLAALVALAILLVGEGVLFKGDGSDPPKGAGAGGAGAGGAVGPPAKFGRQGTAGLELDGERIVRNPASDADIVFYEASHQLAVYGNGAIVAWGPDNQPSFDDCAKLLETHGMTGALDFENGDRFCVRSSKGRTASLAVISEGEEFQVVVWKQG